MAQADEWAAGPFVFLHIDKCGGMSLRELLAVQFGIPQIRPVPHSLKSRYVARTYPIDSNDDLIVQHRAFVHNPFHRLIMGHWDYGIIGKIPGNKRIITVLRNPIRRAVSLYHYIIREERLYGSLSKRAESLGLVDFLRLHKGIWAEAQTRQLAGVRWSDPHLPTTRAIFLEARDNLEQIQHVGVQEQLPIFVSRLCMHYNWAGTLDYVNVGGKQAVTPDNYNVLAEMVPYDMALYEIAKERCQNEIKQSTID